MKGALCICIISMLLSCRHDADNIILPPEKMQAVLSDFIMADVYTTVHIHIDSTKAAQKENARLQKRVFSIHGVTKEQFEYSFDYYTKHSDKMTRILDSIISTESRRNAAPLKGLKYE